MTVTYKSTGRGNDSSRNAAINDEFSLNQYDLSKNNLLTYLCLFKSIKKKINSIYFASDLTRIGRSDAEIRPIYCTRGVSSPAESGYEIGYVESKNPREKNVQKGGRSTGDQGNEGDVARLLLTPVFDQRAWKQEQIQLHPRIQYCSARPFSWRG